MMVAKYLKCFMVYCLSRSDDKIQNMFENSQIGVMRWELNDVFVKFFGVKKETGLESKVLLCWLS